MRPTPSAMMAVIAVTAGIVGCSSSHSSPTQTSFAGCPMNPRAPLVLAVGVRSDVPTTQFPPAANTLLDATANDEQQISLVRIDGQPKLFTLPTFSTNAQNSAARSQDLQTYINTYVNPALRGEIHAKAPEADVLTALSLAASATAPNGNIILIDSGIQTVAPLAYQHPGLLMSPPGDVVSFLRRQHLLPDLHDRHVLLSGFGYAAAPQPTLNTAQRGNLIAQWRAIIKASGGCTAVDTLGNTAPEIAGLPPVSVASLPKTPVFTNCGTIVLSDAGSVGFVVGTATFRDPAAARATLRQLATTLSHGTEHITLIGSTSSEGGDAVNNPLSQERAKAVQTVLVSMGISPSRITPIGEGSHWPGRVKDTGPDGVLLPAQAEQDREVIVQLPKCR